MRPGKLMGWPSRLLLVVLLGLLSGLGVVMAGVSLHAHAAPAATLTVTDCSGETGPGQIGTVISSASAGDTITFSCSGTIPITSTLTISKNLTIDGSGQTITLDGGSSTQVLSVNSGVTFTLKALTIAHGSAFNGGGLLNRGTMSISNSTFSGNSDDLGGGIENNGTLTISNSTFSGNQATIAGGGIDNGGTLTISNSTFSDNSAGTGGGIENEVGRMLTISNSTFSGNSATGLGGGILNNDGTLTISNSTFSGNSVTAGSGGGLFNIGGTATISNSTFANNSASGGGGLFNTGGGTVNIAQSIVANNSAHLGANCFGGVVDNGYNLSSDSSCGFTGTGSLQNTAPKLDPNGLQNNGGPTQTLALEPDSPAVDHIPVGSSCPATDQRGVSRPQGPACDIGAFEMTAADGLSVMIHVVDSFHLAKGLQTSLDAKLTAALKAVQAGDTATACSDLSDFIGQVQAQSGKGLTTAQATQLVNEATVIRTRLGC
jgi:FIMAH domain-containing protein